MQVMLSLKDGKTITGMWPLMSSKILTSSPTFFLFLLAHHSNGNKQSNNFISEQSLLSEKVAPSNRNIPLCPTAAAAAACVPFDSSSAGQTVPTRAEESRNLLCHNLPFQSDPTLFTFPGKAIRRREVCVH